jgi:hypothetical protein
MNRAINLTTAFAILLAMSAPVWAQDPPVAAEEQNKPALDAAQDELAEISNRVDQSEQAELVRAGILKPIYALAEKFSFSAFHWVAFAVMVTGVVSFVLQLTLGKLVVLSRASFSPSEILSDVLGLAVSLIGLVLTTQAATENSDFTTSAFAVISSTCVGAIVGFVFYVWGQRQELQAVEGRKKAAVLEQASTKSART